jgi:hypothetical protein
MTMIPTATLARWKANTDARELTQIEDLIELRGWIQEAKEEGERVILQMYNEAAPAFRMTPRSLQNKVCILREYPADRLRKWINSGIAFDTIKRVGEFYDYGMTNGTPPAEILDLALKNGNGEGKTPTAQEVETFILEQNGIKEQDYILNRMGSKIAKFLNITNYDLFLADLRQLIAKYTQGTG